MTDQYEKKEYFVPQKRPNSGCIPLCYEILLRAANIQGIDYQTFQDEFDFDKYLQNGKSGKNNFDTVRKAIMNKYPHITLESKKFLLGQGKDKLKFVEQYIEERPRILVSIWVQPSKPSERIEFHIMPVLGSTDDNLVLLRAVNDNREPITQDISKSDFVHNHDNGKDGCDVAFLDM